MKTYRDLHAHLAEHKIDSFDVSKRCHHYYNWCKKHRKPKLDPDGKEAGSSQIWFKEYNRALDGVVVCPPHRNLWHWFLDQYDFDDQCTTTNSRHYLDVVVTEAILDESAPDWVSGILLPLVEANEGSLKLLLEVDR